MTTALAPTALMRVAQMAEADRSTIAEGTAGVVLMQNAGEAVAEEIMQRWSPCRVCVMCGPGNNGGDGFVVARVLAAAGWPVRIALLGSSERLTGDAKIHAARWAGPIEPLAPAAIGDAELVVDALFGSGLSRPLSENVALTLAAVGRRGVPLIAVDVPSGVSGDTGESFGAVAAQCTVTFARKKPGHVLLPGRDLAGDVVVADIGTPSSVLDGIAVDTWENDPALWRRELPRPAAGGNKYSRGHALLVGGYPMTGAARMAARGAARAGAGLTSIAVPDIALPIYAAALTSIMVHPLSRPEDFTLLLGDSRYTALLIGPGAGINEATRERALAMLGTRRAVLLDADAISVFAGRAGELAGAIQGPCILTPHEGEFARLFGAAGRGVAGVGAAGDKLSRARAAARSSGAIVVLKGADTVIAAPDGRAMVNGNAPANLATAGSGDVLGGIILGLLAQGMDGFLAAAAGVWLHGAAAADFGPGLLAEDLPDLLPGVLRRLDAKMA
ncbi:MAG: ADP-dependent NAD(P)H-hydrate dehydratase / NAD(P)H-hydrate epimerase [Gammaproteobacteria bacterium]|nr:ADP-dependent NAD(P)H-hydrate dehydratase / NAD(P)H-hydrate epimerase [Gammaproteobacteria bacterium]